MDIGEKRREKKKKKKARDARLNMFPQGRAGRVRSTHPLMTRHERRGKTRRKGKETIRNLDDLPPKENPCD